MSFENDFYQVIERAVPKQVCEFIDAELELLKKISYICERANERDVNHFADHQCKNAFPYYGAFCTDTLAQQLLPKIEEVTGKSLYPTYSYMRIYYTGSDMEKHTDRESCEYSATICISADPEPWEIWFETVNGEQLSLLLQPGDMIVYKGGILPHWRNVYRGKRQTQVFTHYVDANGPYKNYLYDKRPYLGFPPNNE